MSEQLHIISLGAGVQSTTMSLLAAHGEINPMPNCAIFADTGSEPTAVYRHLEWLIKTLPFPVHVVRAWEGYGKPSVVASLSEQLLRAASGLGRVGQPPLYSMTPKGDAGIVRRKCTSEYKIEPIQKKLRELLGIGIGKRWPKTRVVEQWIGISVDEASRMKPSSIEAIAMRWPLIELRMSRRDCLSWLKKNGYAEPPRSACSFCPFHSNAEWRNIRDNDPSGWNKAIEIDRAVRTGLRHTGLDAELFLHPSRVPLEQVDLSTVEERGQINMFENECEGMCGV